MSTIETRSSPDMVIDVLMSYSDPDMNRAFLGEEAGVIVQPPGNDSVIYQRPIEWIVPDLPPGEYLAIRTYVIRYTTYPPVSFHIPFEISPDCM